jgi:hypothetical protein
VAGILKILSGENEANVRYHLQNLVKKSGVLEPLVIKDSARYGFYIKNPKFKSLEEVRQQINDHVDVNGRVVQDGRQFNPLEGVIQAQPSAALPIKQLFLKSILVRMARSNDFTDEDISLIKQELPHLVPEP